MILHSYGSLPEGKWLSETYGLVHGLFPPQGYMMNPQVLRGQLRISGQYHLPRLRLRRRRGGFGPWWSPDLGGALNHPITVGCNDHPQIRGFYFGVYHMIAERWPEWLLIAFIAWKSLPDMSQSYGLFKYSTQFCSGFWHCLRSIGPGSNLKLCEPKGQHRPTANSANMSECFWNLLPQRKPI